jgi:hypothetical protein
VLIARTRASLLTALRRRADPVAVAHLRPLHGLKNPEYSFGDA